MQTNGTLRMLASLETINVVSPSPRGVRNPDYSSKITHYEASNSDPLAVNLGKWILRFLFAKLIEEELGRDAKFRKDLMATTSKPSSLRRNNAPASIQLPVIAPQDAMNEDDSLITPRPPNGNGPPAVTPGLAIGSATPNSNGPMNGNRPSTADEGTSLEKRASQHSQSRTSTERSSDYFSSNTQAKNPADSQSKAPAAPGDTTQEASAQSPVDGDKEEKSKEGGLFGKSFRMKFPKKLGRASTDVKPTIVDEKSEGSDKSDEKEDKTVQDNFFGSIQKIKYNYEERIQHDPSQHLPSGIIPSSFNETPVLRLPPYTTVIIQDERPDSGGVADLYRGTISSVGIDADLIEKVGPMWLGDLLLRVPQRVLAGPFKFVMLTISEPTTCQGDPKGLFHSVAASRSFAEYCECRRVSSIIDFDGTERYLPSSRNSRLNANRMLRAKKILAYVAERIEAPFQQPDHNSLKPEDYLELYCQHQVRSFATRLGALNTD